MHVSLFVQQSEIDALRILLTHLLRCRDMSDHKLRPGIFAMNPATAN